MQTSESCRYCERVTVTVELIKPIESTSDLPNTYDSTSGKYCWRIHDIMAYALIPRAIQGRMGQIDCYVCIDEDDLDDIDLEAYVRTFFKEIIMPQWRTLKGTHSSDPVLAPPEGVDCRKLRHVMQESE